jgi:thioredoxin-related protein
MADTRLMKYVVIAITLLTAFSLAHGQNGVLVSPTGPRAEALPEEKIFDPARDSAKDIADGMKLAAKQHKRVLLDVGGNWCIWCHKLDGTFKSDQNVARLLNDKYVVVKVNFSPENENQAVLSKYPKIPGYPHLFVLDAKGKLLHSEDTSLLESGNHHDPAKVVAFLKQWAR